MQVTRRDALRVVGAGLTVAACGRDRPTRPIEGPRTARKAVVIGAGLAGLTAALALEAGGWEVEVLEADSRIGGRVRTIIGSPLPDGVVMELGGRFVQQGDDAIAEMLEQFGLTLRDEPRRRSGQDLAVCLGGATARGEQVVGTPEASSALGRLSEAFASLRGDTPDTAVADLLDAVGAPDGLRGVLTAVTRTAIGAGTNASAQQLARRIPGPIPDGRMEVAEGGEELIAALARSLTAVPQRRTPVTEILDTGSGVIVTHASGSVTADRVVLAVPPDAALQMSLPGDSLRPALNAVGGGFVTRVLMVYPAPAWEDASLDGRLFGDGPISEATPSARPSGVAEGLLTVDGGAALAGTLGSMAEQPAAVKEAIDACLPLRAIPGGRPAVSKRWFGGLADPFFGPVMPIGWLADAGERQRPHDRVHLAGDHCDVNRPGTLEGAVRSGQRAAAEILSS